MKTKLKRESLKTVSLWHKLCASLMTTSILIPKSQQLYNSSSLWWRGRSRAQHFRDPEARGGHRKGEKLGSGAFATLERRGTQGRADIWVVFSCKGAERDEWRGPKGRADALAVVVLWRKEDRAARPILTGI